MTRKTIDEARKSIFKSSDSAAPDAGDTPIRGYDANEPFEREAFLASFRASGFQSTHLGYAIDILRRMRADREGTGETFKVFLGYTSNQVSSGNRDLIRYLVEHRFVDALVTTAGGIEEDIIKCMKPFLLGDFRAPGAALREAGINRTGNIFVPNDRYIAYEEFLRPIFKELEVKLAPSGKVITPSELIRILGERIDHPGSIYYWAAKHDIPVFCPVITDGSTGDILFFNQYNRDGIKIDIAADNAKLNRLAIDAEKTGALILGGGVAKHQILNANMMREGLDYAVYVNTSSEYDGSDSGAEPEEAKSWGKIASDANTVKLVCDATIALPLLVLAAYKDN